MRPGTQTIPSHVLHNTFTRVTQYLHTCYSVALVQPQPQTTATNHSHLQRSIPPDPAAATQQHVQQQQRVTPETHQHPLLKRRNVCSVQLRVLLLLLLLLQQQQWVAAETETDGRGQALQRAVRAGKYVGAGFLRKCYSFSMRLHGEEPLAS